MKLEYLAQLDDRPLIRLYAFSEAEVRQLRQLVTSLVSGDTQDVHLENEVWAEPVGGCRLSLRLGKRDRGIREISQLNFECILTPIGWSNVEGLLEPFCECAGGGYQWLTDHGSVSLLISQSGHW